VDRHAFEIGLAVNQPVSIVFYIEGAPHMIHGTVESVQPFEISTCDPGASKFFSQRRAVILKWEGESLKKIETEVLSLHFESKKWHLFLEFLTSDEVDRRRYPRFPMRLPVTIRTISESPEGVCAVDISGHTEDLSLGGAWITLEESVDVQSLVEVRTRLTDFDTIRTLAITARRGDDKAGIGVEFIDFIGGARYHLFSFLNRVA